MTVRLAKSFFATSEYDAARALLDEAAASDAGRDDLEVVVAMARVQVRLGDFDAARDGLQRVLAGIEASGQRSLAPMAHLALGELEYVSGRYREARASFERAGEFWTDALPDAASVEAKCYRGALDTLSGKASAAVGNVQASMEQARKMGRLELEAQCRLHLARVYFTDRRYKDVAQALSDIPVDGDRTIGSELLAKLHYWRGQAAAARGDNSESDSERGMARKIMLALKASLPSASRDRFAGRASIREIIEQ
jgi:tetratricopeptide (TPR) repeat protein